jgi:hypothetical protein
MNERKPEATVERTVFLITGNRLVDGQVLYLREDGTWSEAIDEAHAIADAAWRDERVAWAQATFPLAVTGIYAFSVGVTASGERVLSARERLRALGGEATRRRLGHAA